MVGRAARRPKDPLARATREIRPALAAVFVFSLFVNLLVFIPSIYMLQVYDRVMTSRNETTLLMITGIVVVLLFSYATLEHLRSRILVQAGLRLDEALSGPTFDAALRAALRERGSHHAQSLRDVDAVRDFVGGSGVIALLDAPWIPLFLFVCFMFHPLIGLVATTGAVALFVIAWLNEVLTRGPLVEASLLSIAGHERLSASLRNAEAIRGLGMAGAVRGRWQATTARPSTAASRRASGAGCSSPPQRSCGCSCRSESWASAPGSPSARRSAPASCSPPR